MAANKNRIRMLFSFTKGFRLFFLLAVFGSMLAIIFNFLTPQVIKLIIDSVIGNEPFQYEALFQLLGGKEAMRENLIVCCGVALLFSVLSGVATFFYRYFMAKFSEGSIRALRDKLYEHTQKLPYSWHVKNQTGDIIQRCTSDVDVVRNFLSGQLLEMLRTVFLIVFALALMFPISVPITLMTTLFIPVVMAYSGIFYYLIGKKFKVADEAEGALLSMAQENFTGVRVVRAFGRQAHEIERFDKRNNHFANLWIRLGYLLSTYWGIGDLASGLQVMLVIVFGAVSAAHGSITLGGFLVLIFYNSMLVWPIRNLGRILSEMSKTGVSLGRIQDILSQEEEQDCENPLEPDMRGDLEFKHINFDYEGAEPVLKDVSFTVKAGSTFGILGGTGSGKSTLMYLLDRLYELPEGSGSIKIGGVDIRQIKLSHLRRNIGFVLQEPFLFSKTIKENIDIFLGMDDLEMVRSKAKIAAVDDAIMDFEQRYDTIIGERGVTLSGGQKQRVAIARMLTQNAPVMIFDDSLSAVDTETDAKIRAALKDNTGGSTVILISHRITTLMHADHILVLENGRIAETGTHSQLLARSDGIYKKIYDIQHNIESGGDNDGIC